MLRRVVTLLLVLGAGCQFTFNRSLLPGQLRGTVVFATGGTAQVPAAGARVVLEASTITATADAHGSFVVNGLPSGTYAITITASQSGSGVPDSGIRLQGLTLTNGLDLGTIVIGAFGGISGTATLNGEPATGATAVLTGIAQAPLDMTGGFLFNLLPAGDYQLLVIEPAAMGAYASMPISVHVDARVVTPVPNIALGAAPSTSGSITGLVRLLDSTAPTDISIQPADQNGVSQMALPVNSMTGGYSGNVASGIYTLTATRTGYVTVVVSFIVVAGSTTAVPPITLTPGAPPADAGIDAGPVDSGPVDSGSVDSGPVDSGPVDSGSVDSGPIDSGPVDSGPVDSGPVDSGPVDSGPVDSGPVDSGPVDAGPMSPPAQPDGGIWITTIAGNGLSGIQDGTGGPSGSAQFDSPFAIALDGQGNILVVDIIGGDSSTAVLRQVDSAGNVKTLASQLASTQGATVQSASALVLDSAGNAYVADNSSTCVWRITLGQTPSVSPFAGPCDDQSTAVTQDAGIAGAQGLAFDSAGDLYVVDSIASAVWKVVSAGGPDGGFDVSLFAGTPGQPGFSPGPAGTGTLNSPVAATVDPTTGIVYIADPGNNAIRSVESGSLTTVISGVFLQAGEDAGPDGAFSNPTALVADGNQHLYVVAGENPTVIDRVDLAANPITATPLTNVGKNGYLDGPAGRAGQALVAPTAIALDSHGNLVIGEVNNSRIRSMSIAAGAVGLTEAAPAPASPINSGLTTSALFSLQGSGLGSIGLAVDKTGDVFVNETGISGANTLEGTQELDGGAKVTPVIDSESVPDPFGLAVLSDGGLVVAVPGTNTINVALPDGGTQVLAGNGQAALHNATALLSASFNGPWGVAVGMSGKIYVADTGNNVIRLINGTDVTTFAGNGTAGWVDGAATTKAELFHPTAIAVDAAGNVYVVDDGNNTIREISGGEVTTLFGNGQPGTLDGTGGRYGAAQLNYPTGIAVDSQGHVFVADAWTGILRVYDPGSKTVGTLWAPATSNSVGTYMGLSLSLFGVAVDGSGDIDISPVRDDESEVVEQLTCGGEWCGPVCVDFAVDPNNCKSCGQACHASANQSPICVAGTCSVLTTIASGASVGYPVLGLALAQGELVWVDSSSEQLIGAPATGGTASNFASVTPTALGSDGTNFYAGDMSGNVYQISPAGNVQTIATSVQSVGVVGLTVNSGVVYWSDQGGSIWSLSTTATSGTMPGLVIQRDGFGLSDNNSGAQMVVSGSTLYWEENSEGGEFFATPTAGGGLASSIASDPSILFAVPFAVGQASLFWAGSGGIMSAPLQGGGTTTLAAGQYNNVGGVAADDTNVYWTNAVYSGVGVVLAHPVSGGATFTIAVSGIDPTVSQPDLLMETGNTLYWSDPGLSGHPSVVSAPR